MSGERTPRDRSSAWDALTEGRLEENERGLLRALAEEDEAWAARHAAFEPLGSKFEEKLTDELEQSLRAQEERAASSKSSAIQSNVLSFPKRRMLATVAPLAVAAAALLALFGRGEDSELSRYSLTLSPGIADVRGSGPRAEVPRFDAETLLEVVLRPEESPEGNVEVALFVVDARNDIHRVNVAVERASSGALRVRALGKDVFSEVPQGAAEIVAIVARQLPSPEDAIRAIREERPDVLRAPVEWLGAED